MDKEKIQHIKQKLKDIVIPGFEGLSISRVLSFFFDGLKNGVLHVRSSSVAYNTFLAIPPTIIFFFTLIPYMPIPNFDVQLMEFFRSILPNTSFKALESTLYEVVTHRKGGLLSFGFFLSFFFSTNGMHNLIVSFNATAHDTKRRNWFVIRINSFLMVIMQTFLVTLAVALIFYGKATLEYLIIHDFLEKNFTFHLLNLSKLIIIIILFFSAISSLYIMAPVKKESWKFISAGATLATILSLLIALVFTYFVNHFNQWNKLYGSIGTIMASMLWIYLNSFSIILGFELNASIKSAQKSIVNNS